MPQPRYNPLTWACCQCKESVQSLVLNNQCSNGLCQHTRCDSCEVDGYRTNAGVWFPPSPTSLSSGPLNNNNLGLSKETTEKLAYLDGLKAVHRATFYGAAKKYERENNSTSTSASGSDAHSGKSTLERYLDDLVRPTEFVFAWEWSILPFLVEIIPKFLGSGYAINIIRDPRKNSAQTICLTTRVKPTRTRRIIIARHVLDVIPERFCKNTS